MKLSRILAAVATTGALVVAPAAAWAGSNTHADPAGDVASVSSATEITPQPAQVKGDIVSTRVSHLARSVRVKVRFRELAPAGNFAGHYFALRSNTGLRFVELEAGPGQWRGKTAVLNAKEKKVSCKGVSRKIDYTANTVLVVVPRSCLGNPKWVRVASYSLVVEGGVAFADDARVTGLAEGIFYGPRVRR